MPSADRSAAAPTPDSWSSCGELIAPPDRMSSPDLTRLVLPSCRNSTPTARVPVEDDLGNEGPGGHGEVRPAHHRIEVGPRGGQPPPAVDVPVERGEALLPVAVHVVGELVAGLLHGGEERAEQRVGGRAPLEHQRPGVPAERVVRGGRQAVLHPLEVGQAVREVPVGHALVGRPALVVQRVAALEDHPVDAARPAEDLAAGVVDTPPVHVRLRLALVLPVVEPVADRDGERGGHVDERVPDVVRPAGLEHQHPGARVGGQPVRQGAARRPAAGDDEVVGVSCHGCLPRVWGALTLLPTPLGGVLA